MQEIMSVNVSVKYSIHMVSRVVYEDCICYMLHIYSAKYKNKGKKGGVYK